MKTLGINILSYELEMYCVMMFIIKSILLACSLMLAVDDLLAYINVKRVLKDYPQNHITCIRNEILEILSETIGHSNRRFAKISDIVFPIFAMLITFIEGLFNIEFLSLGLSAVTISTAVFLKHLCNKKCNLLKRKNKKIIKKNKVKSEKWDLYTEKRKLTGEEHIRGNELPDDRFHLVVHVWVKNKKGEYLISQRAANRQTNPLMWECIGGSVLKGEESIDGAIREAKEEVGIELLKDRGKVEFSQIRKYVNGEKFNDIMDVWLFEYDGEVELKKATTDEVAQVVWMNLEDIKKLWENEKMVSTLEYFFTEIEKDNE